MGEWLHFAVTSGVAGEEVVQYLVEQVVLDSLRAVAGC